MHDNTLVPCTAKGAHFWCLMLDAGDQVAELLRLANLKAMALHGGLSQGEREGALRDFTKGDVLILVATDVASRGLDIKGIGHVVNLDLPKTFEDYVHRIGEQVVSSS